MHVLDNPVWHALTGPQSTVAQQALLAARYEPDVSVFAALPDEPSNEAWDALRGLVGPGADAVLARQDLKPPAGWTVTFEQECRQMWLPPGAADDGAQEDASGVAGIAVEPLGASDVPEMIELVAQTRPGPFIARTIELGAYFGVREAGTLIAMAGERMHPAGFTEISAVCTDPEYRGRGLASSLVRVVAREIRARNEMPFLNLRMKNEAAHRVYSALGFETRGNFQVTGVRAPS